ncbi:Cupredoxin [Flammula alnicola]|nr:Cupredoxin [Flammula alnicola]
MGGVSVESKTTGGRNIFWNLTIIEVDGQNVQPLVVDSIQIYAGQRYSFILNANQTLSNYWIRANPNVGTKNFAGGLNSAILRYSGADAVDPTTTVSLTNALLETNLHPLTDPSAPGTATLGAADVNLNLLISNTAGKFSINGASFAPPTVPVLLQILSGASTAADLLPTGSVYVLPANKVVELSLPGGAPGSPHPIHLHGHAFSVIRSAGSTTYNYVDPVRRDVVSIGAASDNVTIRFETDNSGPWIMHCHIDWHLEAGLAIVFAEDTSTIASSSSLSPTAWDNLCPTYDAAPVQTFT